MKKILVAFFLAIIMLLVPISSVANTVDIPNIKSIYTLNIESPQIVITEEDHIELVSHIENTFDNQDDKNDAYDILNSIIGDDLVVDSTGLSNAWILYGYPTIPDSALDDVLDLSLQNPVEARTLLNALLDQYWSVKNGEMLENLFGNLIAKIIEIIQGRLGWIHYFFDQGVDLFVDGVRLIIDYIQLPIALIVAVVAFVNQILSIPGYFFQLLKDLFSLEFTEFLAAVENATIQYSADLIATINGVIDTLEDFKDIFELQEIIDYLTAFNNYFTWLGSEPWKEPITVSGKVTINMASLAGATITCRGKTTTTNSNGDFSFSVDSTPADDSFPANEWYGMHNCSITVSKDGEVLKQTPSILSYAFSGGKINWPFVIIKGKSKDVSILERFNIFIETIQNIFPNIFRNINRSNIKN
jgi:hypothetical protein